MRISLQLVISAALLLHTFGGSAAQTSTASASSTTFAPTGSAGITRALKLVVASGYTESLSAPAGAIASKQGALLCNLVWSAKALLGAGLTALSNCTLRGFFPPPSPYARTSAYQAILRLQFSSTGAYQLTSSSLLATCANTSTAPTVCVDSRSASQPAFTVLSSQVDQYPDCDLPSDQMCSPYATCIDLYDNYTCVCREDFFDAKSPSPGFTCTEKCEPELCSGVGNCTEHYGSVAVCTCPDAYAGLQCEFRAWQLAGDTRQLFIYLIIFGAISIILMALMLVAICWRRVRDSRALKREREREEREQKAQMKNVLDKTLIPPKRKYKHKEPGDLPKRGSFAHLLHSLSHLHLLPRRGSRTSLHSDERQEGSGTGSAAGGGGGAGAAASGEHEEQREPARTRRYGVHGARHDAKEQLRKSKSHQEFGSILKPSDSKADLDAGISISAHAPAAAPAGEALTLAKSQAADVEPERSAGMSFSLGGTQLSPRAQPATTDAADTGFEMRNLSVTAQVEAQPAADRAVKFEDTTLQSSIRRRQPPQ